MIAVGQWCDVTVLPDGEAVWIYMRGHTVICESVDPFAPRWARDTGRQFLYLRAAADGQGRVCAVGVGQDDQAACVIDGGAPVLLGAAHGNYAVEIEGLPAGGWRIYVQRTSTTYHIFQVTADGSVVGDDIRGMPATSQGFLDIRAGVLITSDAGRHAHGLVLPNVAAGVWAGQLPDPNGLALFDETTGTRSTLLLGDSQPPHIAESSGAFYVCAWRPQGAWIERYTRPFEGEPEPEPEPEPGDSMIGIEVGTDFTRTGNVGGTGYVPFKVVSDAPVTEVEVDLIGDGLGAVVLKTGDGGDLRRLRGVAIVLERSGALAWQIRAKNAKGERDQTGAPRHIIVTAS